MKLNEDTFLLSTKTSRVLYDRIKDTPIFDFHSHLNPKEIYENHQFENATQLWLKHDHYKWRLMRTSGIEEKYITGDSPDNQKFEAFINILKNAFMNPMYHWCTMELNKYFNINKNYEDISAENLYEEMNLMLQKESMKPRNILKQSNVSAVFTTDDPLDDLKYHRLLLEDESFDIKLLPTFRPDAYIDFTKIRLNDTIEKIERVTNQTVTGLTDYIDILTDRIDYFHSYGCRASDHSFESVPEIGLKTFDAGKIFESIRNGEAVSESEKSKLTSFVFGELSRKYKAYSFVVQLHLGPLRNNNQKAFPDTGSDSGFDSIGNSLNMKYLNAFLNELEINNQLTDTIIYPNNPNDHFPVQSAAGNFSNYAHKIQLGAAWWYNDTKEGMERHLEEYANIGILGTFVGMLTDSRSLVSFPRHDYFRRILCDQFGRRIEKGEMTRNVEFVSKVIEDISFNNAVKLFNLEGEL